MVEPSRVTRTSYAPARSTTSGGPGSPAATGGKVDAISGLNEHGLPIAEASTSTVADALDGGGPDDTARNGSSRPAIEKVSSKESPPTEGIPSHGEIDHSDSVRSVLARRCHAIRIMPAHVPYSGIPSRTRSSRAAADRTDRGFPIVVDSPPRKISIDCRHFVGAFDHRPGRSCGVQPQVFADVALETSNADLHRTTTNLARQALGRHVAFRRRPSPTSERGPWR